MTAGMPARRYSWAPFAAGHELSTTHGAKSPRKVSPIAEQIMAEIVEVAPWAGQSAFGPSLSALSWTEAQLVLVRQYVDEHGPLAEDGTPLPALSTLNELERRAARQRAEFGLSPTTWAALRRAVVGDPDGGTSGAAAVRAVGRQLLEATVTPIEERSGQEVGPDADEERDEHGEEQEGSHHQQLRPLPGSVSSGLTP